MPRIFGFKIHSSSAYYSLAVIETSNSAVALRKQRPKKKSDMMMMMAMESNDNEEDNDDEDEAEEEGIEKAKVDGAGQRTADRLSSSLRSPQRSHQQQSAL